MADRKKQQAAQTDRWMILREAAAYLGVSTAKMSRIIKNGELEVRTDPLDRRVKFVKERDVERLRRASMIARIRRVDGQS
jgi:DNA-binding MarR family transcriptional regulator